MQQPQVPVTPATLADLNKSGSFLPSSPMKESPLLSMDINQDWSSEEEEENPLSKITAEENGDWNVYCGRIVKEGEELLNLPVAEIEKRHKEVVDEVIKQGGDLAVKTRDRLEKFKPILKKCKQIEATKKRERARAKKERKKMEKVLSRASTKGYVYKKGANSSSGEYYLVPKSALQVFLNTISKA